MGSYQFQCGDGRFGELTASGAKTAGTPGVLGLAKLPYIWLSDTPDTKVGPIAFFGMFDLSVHGYGEAAGEAVAVGDKIYLDGTELNKDETNGDFFGIAMEVVSADATTVIKVLVGYLPGVDIA